MITLICGTRPERATCCRKIAPYPPSAPAPSSMRAPPEAMKPDDRGLRPAGQVEYAHDRLGLRGAERSAGEALVLRVAVDRPPADAAGAGDDAVAGRRARGAGGDPRPDQLERARIAERLEPLERSQPLALGAASASIRFMSAASMQSTTLWPPKPNELLIPIAGWPFRGSAFAPSGT